MDVEQLTHVAASFEVVAVNTGLDLAAADWAAGASTAIVGAVKAVGAAEVSALAVTDDWMSCWGSIREIGAAAVVRRDAGLPSGAAVRGIDAPASGMPTKDISA